MKYLIRGPRHIYKYFYTNSNEKEQMRTEDPEPCDILTDKEIELEVREVTISLPFGGNMRGKWWGLKNVRPIVCLHGWQDNAGTFDRLIPLLPRECSYLALDLPGHGLSDFIPDGMQYHTDDSIYLLLYLMKEYNWDKISLIGHSMSAKICFLFASMFPHKTDLVVGIDGLKPTAYNPVAVAKFLGDTVENFMVADKRNQEKSEPPTYTIDEMIEKMVQATRGSVTQEVAMFLLKRNIQNSKKYPGKFYFARDNRLKFMFGAEYSHEIGIELAKRIDIPYMYIKAAKNTNKEKKQHYEEVLGVMNQNPKFEHHLVDSTHHLHLTEPEKIAAMIGDFIQKYRKLQSKL